MTPKTSKIYELKYIYKKIYKIYEFYMKKVKGLKLETIIQRTKSYQMTLQKLHIWKKSLSKAVR